MPLKARRPDRSAQSAARIRDRPQAVRSQRAGAAESPTPDNLPGGILGADRLSSLDNLFLLA